MRMARDVNHVLSVQELRLLELARADAVRRYALEHAPRPAAAPGTAPEPAAANSANPAVREAAAAPIEEAFATYFKLNLGYLQAVTILDSNRQPVFRLNR